MAKTDGHIQGFCPDICGQRAYRFGKAFLSSSREGGGHLSGGGPWPPNSISHKSSDKHTSYSSLVSFYCPHIGPERQQHEQVILG